MSITMSFCGAAGTVTGSCYWVRAPRANFLVDCGMFQGPKTLKELNYGRFPFPPDEIDFVLLTHAHIDHSGLIPKLYKRGFQGPVLTTSGSRDLLTYMLPDSGHIQEIEVEHLNRRNRRRGRPEVMPIYTREDAEACLKYVRPVDYDRWTEVGAGVRARFWNAGHILGSASIELEFAGARARPALRALFSGDIGPEHRLFLPAPEAPHGIDVLVSESTYGGRTRPHVTPAQRRALLAREVNDAMARKGVMLIPSFAIERTQDLLLDLAVLFRQRAIPRVPVFLDSPLAIHATEVFARHASELAGVSGNPFHAPNFHFTLSGDESRALERIESDAIIMAASGMCDAGRIRFHLKNHLWRREATVLLVGYQAPGTLGRVLAEGAKMVRIQGEEVRVRATIRSLDVYSAHADGDELVDWIRRRLPVRRALYLTHGDDAERAALHDALLALDIAPERIFMPRLDDVVDLAGKSLRPHRGRGRPRRLPPTAVGAPDWHNDLARLTLTLREHLEQAPDDKARRRLLRRLWRLLDGKGLV